MLDKIKKIKKKALTELEKINSLEILRDFEVKFLGKKGEITVLLKGMGKVPPENRKEVGQAVNGCKIEIRAKVEEKEEKIKEMIIEKDINRKDFDITLPSQPLPHKKGTIHPVVIIQNKVEAAFEQLGFKVLDYFEAEDDWHNFEGLNIPKDHPARDMQDTFWLKDGNLLRTHTSPGQLRAMHDYPPPFRAIFPGKVFRYEKTDASHEHTFHQVEGLMIDKNLSVANLIGIMKILLEAIFERKVDVRLRPGFFPFVEPGFELDIKCMNCNGKGCQVCKYSGWVELLPCGLVHPNVIRAGGLDPDEWSGWAFGLGLTRLAMMKYKISHITHFLGGDLRFYRQFTEGGLK
ncbi:MAG: phenylalanine--tRNA ligase subunit alpha [Deltaproteobacteria bacterium]|jgi:phenylalanyl-tRNA synthetase alpha chain|nr:phenylalanine--tRNA ligase subunit alpha [Deltaproteobacteria bacterium]